MIIYRASFPEWISHVWHLRSHLYLAKKVWGLKLLRQNSQGESSSRMSAVSDPSPWLGRPLHVLETNAFFFFFKTTSVDTFQYHLVTKMSNIHTKKSHLIDKQDQEILGNKWKLITWNWSIITILWLSIEEIFISHQHHCIEQKCV